MIAKNIKGKGFAGCIRYVMNETCELLEAEGVFAESAKSIIYSFAMQRSMRSEITKPVGHIPISFSPEDKPLMTNDFMLQLAKEYMQEMGIKNTQYIVVRHHNTDNDHLHIVYNRVDNDLKLISVNNDYKRNIEVCKKLKDKHGLTYGKGKERVKRERLNNPDKAKYYIYDAIKTVLPSCKIPADLRFALHKFGVEIDYKFKRTTNEIEGVSFRYSNIAFKGSQIDRKFSYGNLKKEFEKNNQAEQLIEPKEIQRQATEKPKKEELIKIGGILLTREQTDILKQGSFIYLENMTNSKGQKFSAYAFTDDKQQQVLMSQIRPDEFVKFGKYEMRIMDKRLIEAGFVTRAKVKWWGGIDYQYPYLWKENKSDLEYKENWGDPRVLKEETKNKQQSQHQNTVQKKEKKNKPKL